MLGNTDIVIPSQAGSHALLRVAPGIQIRPNELEVAPRAPGGPWVKGSQNNAPVRDLDSSDTDSSGSESPFEDLGAKSEAAAYAQPGTTTPSKSVAPIGSLRSGKRYQGPRTETPSRKRLRSTTTTDGGEGPSLPDYVPFEDDPAEGNYNADQDVISHSHVPRVFGGTHKHKTFSHLLRLSRMVKVGDNTITTDGIHDKKMVETPASEASPVPNYISKMATHIINSCGSFSVHDGAYQIQSYLTPMQAGGGYRRPQKIEAPVFRFFAAPPAAREVASCEVSWGPPVVKGNINAESLSAFLTGGLPDERRVLSALNPILAPANVNVAKGLATAIQDKLLIPNNFMMYAKIYWNAMIHELNIAANHAATILAFDPNPAITFINLDDVNINAGDITSRILAGDVIFVGGLDYMGGDDLQILTWLVQSGQRFSTPDGTQCPHACYMKFPSIPITVLTHGPAPDRPDPTTLTYDKIWAVLRRWAEQRCEVQDLMMGVYWVMTHFGIRYTNAVDHPVYEFVLPDLGCNNITCPRPTDYNFILRLCRIYPAPDHSWIHELQAWQTIGATSRVALAALYSYAVSTFTSTAMLNWNLEKQLIVHWNTGALQQYNLAYTIMEQMFRCDGATQEAVLHTAVWNCFRTYMNVQPCQSVTVGRPWSGCFGKRADAGTSYSFANEGAVVRMGNYLAIDDWLVTRPIEWGVLGSTTTISFGNEIVLMGADNHCGWHANKGSKDYDARASASNPTPYVEYGAMGLNAIGQNVQDRPVVRLDTCQWVPGCHVAWATNDVEPVGPVWLDSLKIFEPGTILTYDYVNNKVLAPRIKAQNPVNRAMLQYMSMWRGSRVENIGFYLKDNSSCGAGVIQIGFGLSGMFAPVPPQRTAQAPESLNNPTSIPTFTSTQVNLPGGATSTEHHPT